MRVLVVNPSAVPTVDAGARAERDGQRDGPGAGFNPSGAASPNSFMSASAASASPRSALSASPRSALSERSPLPSSSNDEHHGSSIKFPRSPKSNPNIILGDKSRNSHLEDTNSNHSYFTMYFFNGPGILVLGISTHNAYYDI
jgi:hypothetical protein